VRPSTRVLRSHPKVTTLLAQNVLLALLTFAAVGLLFAWAAWHAARRWGGAGLAAAWAGGAILAAVLMTARVHQQQAALGFTPAQQQRFPVFTTFLPMWAAGFGGVALMLRGRRRRGTDGFSLGVAGRSLAAFVGGVVAFLLVYAALDVAALLR